MNLAKTVGYKVNTQKTKALLYTNNEISEMEIWGKNPIWYSNKKKKYLGINLTS